MTSPQKLYEQCNVNLYKTEEACKNVRKFFILKIEYNNQNLTIIEQKEIKSKLEQIGKIENYNLSIEHSEASIRKIISELHQKKLKCKEHLQVLVNKYPELLSTDSIDHIISSTVSSDNPITFPIPKETLESKEVKINYNFTTMSKVNESVESCIEICKKSVTRGILILCSNQHEYAKKHPFVFKEFYFNLQICLGLGIDNLSADSVTRYYYKLVQYQAKKIFESHGVWNFSSDRINTLIHKIIDGLMEDIILTETDALYDICNVNVKVSNPRLNVYKIIFEGYRQLIGQFIEMVNNHVKYVSHNASISPVEIIHMLQSDKANREFLEM